MEYFQAALNINKTRMTTSIEATPSETVRQPNINTCGVSELNNQNLSEIKYLLKQLFHNLEA